MIPDVTRKQFLFHPFFCINQHKQPIYLSRKHINVCVCECVSFILHSTSWLICVCVLGLSGLSVFKGRMWAEPLWVEVAPLIAAFPPPRGHWAWQEPRHIKSTACPLLPSVRVFEASSLKLSTLFFCFVVQKAKVGLVCCLRRNFTAGLERS